ncbi:MAG: hypothetical protein BSOLF_1330 [Candidatus Carbobacillus altaicus]|uniref:Uncharacterized protein n=1 Tax=Candidatus Carbonibacillus altaicus TaxID=2163959 RepID=A0A2R6XZH8_9BACL|nr:MAG: hypothetical protein BSOLF_1330 [Candidatus Carbobacillus altaicus]
MAYTVVEDRDSESFVLILLVGTRENFQVKKMLTKYFTELRHLTDVSKASFGSMMCLLWWCDVPKACFGGIMIVQTMRGEGTVMA